MNAHPIGLCLRYAELARSCKTDWRTIMRYRLCACLTATLATLVLGACATLRPLETDPKPVEAGNQLRRRLRPVLRLLHVGGERVAVGDGE